MGWQFDGFGWVASCALGVLIGGAGGGVPAMAEAPASAARGLVVTEIDQADVVNRRPRFLSLAPLTAREGRLYRYGFAAEDPDGDELSYTLVEAPEGARLRGRTLTWVPGRGQAGSSQEFTLRAADSHGLVRDQVWQVTPDDQRAPRFLSKAPGHWPRAGGYVYSIHLVSAPGRGRLRLALEKAPAGTLLKGRGRHWTLTWNPAPDRPEGRELFILRAADATGAVALQAWTVDGR